MRSPHENGDVESSNGGLKRALKQHLLLRGSRDFESIESYEAFLFEAMEKRNRGRQQRFAEELAAMRHLPSVSVAIYREYKVPVSRGGTIRVLRNLYSVPTSLIGHTVTVHVYEWHLEVRYGGKLMERMPRLIGSRKHQINYRHLIDTLLRKPGGFRDYRYRDALFPSLVFRRAWERLNRWHMSRQADLAYLRILNLAARTMETDVEAALELLLDTDEPWTERDVEQLLELDPTPVPQIARGEVTLTIYDRLLQEACYEPA